MKVVLSTWTVYPFHGFGGVERYYYNLAKSLKAESIDVTIVASGKPSNVRCNGINFKLLPPDIKNLKLKQMWLWFFGRNVQRYLQNNGFDILHGTEGTYPYSKLKNRSTVLMHCLGLAPFQNPNLWIKMYNFLFAYYRNYLAYHKADAVAAEGRPQMKELERIFNVPISKMYTLHAGIYINEITDAIKKSKLTRKEIGVDDADIVLVNVNRLATNKGVSYLIEALAQLNKEINVKLILIGTGPEEDKIKKQINRLRLKEKVKHFKNIPDKMLYQLLGLADISVTPTLFEGLPTVVLEAMAAGKPIVATDIPEMSQVVYNGKNGFIVQCRDAKAIVNAVMKIYDKNLQKKMSIQSRKIIKDYDWPYVTKETIKIYEKILQNKSSKYI